MANIHQTIAEINELSPELATQVRRFVKDHSYGLVFEKNLPDSVRLWTKKPVKYDKVHIIPPRGEFDKEDDFKEWFVSDIVDGTATLTDGNEIKLVSEEDIVPVVGHKDVIYPGLKIVDKVERGSKDDPYHMVINAENYHALEALVYAYAGKVDCIYIDPPYNTGASDWKYNNNYVSQDDQYRHSKWLTMMERRLKLAKKLLNPEDSVMIVTIDEKEYLRLGMLLEQIFPEARIQMISSVINRSGAARDSMFSRVDEYLFIVMFGICVPSKLSLSKEWVLAGDKSLSLANEIGWRGLLRRGSDNTRTRSPGCFYPIVISKKLNRVVYVGNPNETQHDIDKKYDKNSHITCFPIRPDGIEGRWQLSSDKFKEVLSKGYVKFGKLNAKQGLTLYYLPRGEQLKVEKGIFKLKGYNDIDGSALFDLENNEVLVSGTTQWNIISHDARQNGTILNLALLPDRKFPYPKSVYAVEDVLRFFVADKPNALIVDFFAGSGTTAHATMLLNHLDGGHRRTIMVTNNEIGPDAEKDFTENKKLRPSDEEWKKYGIARYITWERVKAAITGINTKGEPIKGDYKFTEEFPMSEGFKENAVFCELTYENLWDIRLDRAFNAVAPILWTLAGCRGPIIEKLGKGYATTCNYAVLFKYDAVSKFVEAVKKSPSIEHIFVVTDDQTRFTNIVKRLYMVKPGNIHRLYEGYLKSFEIVGEGGLD